jgi:hypothetical protein
MKETFFKPNKSNTGFMAEFQLGRDSKSGNPKFYAKVVAQETWDPAARSGKGNGTFKNNLKDPMKSINVGLETHELAGIIRVIDANFRAEGLIIPTEEAKNNLKTWSTVHDGKDYKTQLYFKPYVVAAKSEKDPNLFKCYYFELTSDKIKGSDGNKRFSIAITFDEAAVLKEFFKAAIIKLLEGNSLVPNGNGEGGYSGGAANGNGPNAQSYANTTQPAAVGAPIPGGNSYQEDDDLPF